jgi:hypothetical protein
MLHFRALIPPSTVKMTPLVYPERSEARNTIRSAISRGFAERPRGKRCTNSG